MANKIAGKIIIINYHKKSIDCQVMCIYETLLISITIKNLSLNFGIQCIKFKKILENLYSAVRLHTVL